MKIAFISPLIYFHIVMTVQAQTTSPGFDSAWAAKFQYGIESHINQAGVRGASVAVYFPGEGTYIGVVGNSHNGVPITSDMQFCIGSNTKLFTSVILLKLQELGMLSLDDPIDAWLPAYPNIDGSITIRQLLSHQSGISDYLSHFSQEELENLFFNSDTLYDPETLISQLDPPYFPPGEGFRISNSNYILAGLIIETSTGKSYTENLHQFIFDPLDFDSTFLSVYEAPNGNVAHGWFSGMDVGNDPGSTINSLNWAAGGIYSTAKEMTEWYDQLFTWKSIIDQASLDQLLEIEPSSLYGLGILRTWYKTEDDSYVGFGNQNSWEYNSYSGYNVVIGYDIKSGGILCVMVNGEDYSEDVVYDLLIPVVVTFNDDFLRQPIDAGISTIPAPALNECFQDILPVVELKNYGTEKLTSVTVNYQLDDGPVNQYYWSGNLTTDENFFVPLPEIIIAGGPHVFTSWTSDPNGKTDGYSFNDLRQSDFVVRGMVQDTLFEGFEEEEFPPEGWLNGLNAILNWRGTGLASHSGKRCAVKHNYIDDTHRSYDLDLPILDLSSHDHPVLSFYYAYTAYPDLFDSFEVLASSECVTNPQSIFYKEGDQLLTAPIVEHIFTPSKDQWKQVNLDLSEFNAETWIKFRIYNGEGNNIYLDDVRVGEGCPIPIALSVSDVTSTTARVSWTYSGQPSFFNVYYRIVDSVAWTRISLNGNEEELVLQDLVPGAEYTWYVTADCHLGTSPESEAKLFSTSFTGVKDLFDGAELHLFPNPASGIITLSYSLLKSTPLHFSLKTVAGVILVEWTERNPTGSYQNNLDVSSYSPGLYLIEMKSAEGNLVKKLIIE